MPIGSRRESTSRQSSQSGEKDYGVQVGFWEHQNEKKRIPFWRGKLSAEQIERLANDFPNGCDVYINENKDGGKETSKGKTRPHLNMSFREPYVGKKGGGDRGNNRGDRGQYDERDV